MALGKLFFVTAMAMAMATVVGCASSDYGEEATKLGENASKAEGESADEVTPPPPPECPAVAAPLASECPGGTWTEKRNAQGCVSGFDCVVCPAVAAPHASSCDGTWVERRNANGCVSGFDCVK